MKVSNLLGERFREAPSDCTIASHKLMVKRRIYEVYGKRHILPICAHKAHHEKIEKIIREEMDRIDAGGHVPRRHAGDSLGAERKVYRNRQRNGALYRQERQQDVLRHDA